MLSLIWLVKWERFRKDPLNLQIPISNRNFDQFLWHSFIFTLKQFDFRMYHCETQNQIKPYVLLPSVFLKGHYSLMCKSASRNIFSEKTSMALAKFLTLFPLGVKVTHSTTYLHTKPKLHILNS